MEENKNMGLRPETPAAQAMTSSAGAPRLEDMMRARAEQNELEAQQLRQAADEIERARMSGARMSGATLDVLRGMFWRSV